MTEIKFGSLQHILRAFPGISPSSTGRQYQSLIGGKTFAKSDDPISWVNSGKSLCAKRLRAQLLRALVKDCVTNGTPLETPDTFLTFVSNDGLQASENRLLLFREEMKDGVNTRSKTDSELSNEVDRVIEWVDDHVRNHIPTEDTLFCAFLPPRRPSDFSNFFVCDVEPENISEINAYIRSSETLVFNSYKNSKIHGEQRFHIRDPRLAEICLAGSAGLNKAIQFLNDKKRYPSGEITLLKMSPRAELIAKNRGGFSNNAFRHAVESKVSRVASRAARIYALKFLAHSAHTALHFYSFGDS